MNTTLEMLQDISEYRESKDLKSSPISAGIINQLNDFEEQNVIARGTRKQTRLENSTTAAEFYTQIINPFLLAFLLDCIQYVIHCSS